MSVIYPVLTEHERMRREIWIQSFRDCGGDTVHKKTYADSALARFDETFVPVADPFRSCQISIQGAPVNPGVQPWPNPFVVGALNVF